MLREYVTIRACTFRNRVKGASARLYAKGADMSTADDDLKVPEDKFKLVKGSEAKVRKAVSAMNGDDVRQELVDLGITFNESDKVKDLKDLLKKVRDDAAEAESEDDDDMLE